MWKCLARIRYSINICVKKKIEREDTFKLPFRFPGILVGDRNMAVVKIR